MNAVKSTLNNSMYGKRTHEAERFDHILRELVIVPIVDLPQAEQVYNCAIDLVGLWLDSRWEYNADECFNLALSNYIERFLDDDPIGTQKYWGICKEVITILQPSLIHAMHLPALNKLLGTYRLTGCFKNDRWSVVLEFHLNSDETFY